MSRSLYSIRLPVHGFVEFDEWERDIINHTVFQRLRRIRQLAFSEHLYPGSTHSRFEHSLGVMHVATRLFDRLVEKYETVIEERLGCNLRASNARTIVRLGALLHDVGHGPLSHGAEFLMPTTTQGKSFKHEDYSAALVEHEMRDVFNEHRVNQQQFNISSKDVADFIRGTPLLSAERLFWRELVSGQLDADRMDYLLRDSYHCGVSYGAFDLSRIVDTITVVEDSRDSSPAGLRIGIEPGGRHAAEGLILARYFMFQQVYFHVVRKAFDHHAEMCLKDALIKSDDNGRLPSPATTESRQRFLGLDDWTVFEYCKENPKDRNSIALLEHRHDRMLEQTDEVASIPQIEDIEKRCQALREDGIEAWIGDADKEWYKINATEIRISRGHPGRKPSRLHVPRADPLSVVSNVVQRIQESKQRRLYVPELDFSAIRNEES